MVVAGATVVVVEVVVIEVVVVASATVVVVEVGAPAISVHSSLPPIFEQTRKCLTPFTFAVIFAPFLAHGFDDDNEAEFTDGTENEPTIDSARIAIENFLRVIFILQSIWLTK